MGIRDGAGTTPAWPSSSRATFGVVAKARPNGVAKAALPDAEGPAGTAPSLGSSPGVILAFRRRSLS